MENKNTCPFSAPKKEDKKFKILVWGNSGSGKTTFGLSMPNPVVVDMEGSTELYGDKNFKVLHTTSLREVKNALVWLQTQQHEFKTIVIDPVTIFWEELQRSWTEVFLKRCQGKQNKTEFFELGPSEWRKIKDSYSAFLLQLANLDMNVVAIAREKTRYRDGAFMVADGVSPDCEKRTEYFFPVEFRLYVEKGEFLAETRKDKSCHLKAGEIIRQDEILSRLGIIKNNSKETKE